MGRASPHPSLWFGWRKREAVTIPAHNTDKARVTFELAGLDRADLWV